MMMTLARRSWSGLKAVGLILCCLSSLARDIQAQVLTRPDSPLTKRVEVRRKVPAKVEAVLKTIDETGKAPPGVLGGRVYENHVRSGEQPLPRVDREGDPITYHTWDVNPRVAEQDRGQERLIVGSDGSAYYSADYYKTFVTVRNPSRSVYLAPERPEVNKSPKPEMPKDDRPHPIASNRNAPVEKRVVSLDPKTAARVNPVVEFILDHDAPPPDTVGGRDFRNLGLEEGEVLPRNDAKGRPVRYREWDVNRRVPGRNRGAERLITGSDGRVYYTSDHYATFQRIR